jgi:trehalose synthase
MQVSRWDCLKDMTAVMAALSCAQPPQDVYLMLAAPAVTGVTDDPGGAEVLAEGMAACLPRFTHRGRGSGRLRR